MSVKQNTVPGFLRTGFADLVHFYLRTFTFQLGVVQNIKASFRFLLESKTRYFRQFESIEPILFSQAFFSNDLLNVKSDFISSFFVFLS